MITRVRAKNFRSLADIDVTLGPLTVLVGKNGAGKSAFVDVLGFVRDALTTSFSEALGKRQGMERLRFSSALVEEMLQIGIEVEEPRLPLRGMLHFSLDMHSNLIYEQGKIYTVEPLETRSPVGMPGDFTDSYMTTNGVLIEEPKIQLFTSGMNVSSSSALLMDLSRHSHEYRVLMDFLRGVEIFDVSSEEMRSVQNDRGNEMQNHQEFFLIENRQILFKMIEFSLYASSSKGGILSFLKLIVPTVTDIRMSKSAGNLAPEIQHSDGTWRNLKQESDGTVRLLGILCALYQILAIPYKKHTTLIIEEPEISIYPEYLEVLANVIREASKDRQIIITTQSPDLISCFSADEIRVVESVEGQTKIGPLGAHQREVLNQELFSLGDLLRVEGLWRDDSDA
ncbi:AAA family ATPase [Armatimonas sp.]|uniref:AAA family ATPase n=1 Tax=Armatimonas sp. TaxID=1872638 RepID=UPI00375104DF